MPLATGSAAATSCATRAAVRIEATTWQAAQRAAREAELSARGVAQVLAIALFDAFAHAVAAPWDRDAARAIPFVTAVAYAAAVLAARMDVAAHGRARSCVFAYAGLTVALLVFVSLAAGAPIASDEVLTGGILSTWARLCHALVEIFASVTVAVPTLDTLTVEAFFRLDT